MGQAAAIAVHFKGPAIRVPDFAELLKNEGYSVDFTPPIYLHPGEHEPDDMATAALFVVGRGSGRAIGDLARDFQSRSEGVPVGIEVGGI